MTLTPGVEQLKIFILKRLKTTEYYKSTDPKLAINLHSLKSVEHYVAATAKTSHKCAFFEGKLFSE